MVRFQEIDEPFFLVEIEYVLFRGTPKELFQELASFHMRLMNALLLTGVMILTFRYTGVKGKCAKIGLWMLLIGVLALVPIFFTQTRAALFGCYIGITVILIPSAAWRGIHRYITIIVKLLWNMVFALIHIYTAWFLSCKDKNGLMDSIFSGYKYVTKD